MMLDDIAITQCSDLFKPLLLLLLSSAVRHDAKYGTLVTRIFVSVYFKLLDIHVYYASIEKSWPNTQNLPTKYQRVFG